MAPGQVPPATAAVTVDSSEHELTIKAGPYDLPNVPPMDARTMMNLGMGHHTPGPTIRVADRRLVPRLPRDLVDAKGHRSRATSCTTSSW